MIESLSLEMRVGERVALRGPNGAGKTTVLRCVGGTVTPTRQGMSQWRVSRLGASRLAA